ncbi:MAG: AAA family ATPase [bacterium]
MIERWWGHLLVIVCGLQGVGKTTVAKKIAENINAVLLRTDVIRGELFETPRYTEEEKQKVYEEMFSRARKSLREGRDVVLDATFIKKENRDRARKIAKEEKADFKIVEVVCSEDIVKKRIEERFGDESEAKFEHFLKYKNSFGPIIGEHIIIDNSGTFEDIGEQLREHFLGIRIAKEGG